MSRRFLAGVAAAALSAGSLSGCFFSSDDDGARPLPIAGKTPEGEPYRLEAGQPPGDEDDVDTSWCLRLRWNDGISVIHGRDEPGRSVEEDAETDCGPSPAPRVSGVVQVHCDKDTLFVVGGSSSRAGMVELVPERGKRIRARHGALPPGSGFEGTSFVLTARVPAALPATLREVESRQLIVRVPPYSQACARLPKELDDRALGNSFLTFPED